MLTLKSGKTINIKAITPNGEETIDITTEIGELVPQLTLPSWLDVVANTSAPAVKDFSNVQFRALAKAEPTVTYKDGEYVTKPADLIAHNIKVNLCQITPTKIAEKVELDDIDLNTTNYKDVLPKFAATWLLQVNKECEIYALKQLAYEAQEFQTKIIAENNDFTTFEKGAHLEKVANLTPEKAYDLLSKLKSVITKTGLDNAKSNIDKNFKFATGINMSDVVVLCSNEFMDTILRNQGVFASDKGIEIFQKMGIKNLLGFDVLAVPELPDGVHFIAITTGQMGTLGKGDVADGHYFNVKDSYKWSKNKELEQERTFYLGVIYSQLIWMATDANFQIAKPNLRIRNTSASYVVNESNQYFETENAKSTRIQEMSNEFRKEVLSNTENKKDNGKNHNKNYNK